MSKAELIQFSLPNLTKGHPVIIFRCSICNAIVEENIRTNVDDYNVTLKDVLTCTSCNNQLQYDIHELRNIARFDITALTQKFHLLPTFIQPDEQTLSCEPLKVIDNNILSTDTDDAILSPKNILPFAPESYKKALDEFILAAVAVRGLLRIILLGCRSDRVGHILQNTANFLVQLDLDKCLIFGGPQDLIANYNSMTSFWHPHILFGRWVREACLLCIASPLTKDLVCDIRWDTEFNHLSQSVNFMTYSLNEEDNKEGKRRLNAILKTPQNPYVCFLGRDSLYVDEHYKRAPGFFNYHNSRDMDIDVFLPTMKYLSEKNITSFRMGSLVRKKLSSSEDKNIIDYASFMHSELMDFYLPIHSKFCVYIASGLSILPIILGSPILLHILWMPFPSFAYSCKNTFNIYKRMSFNGKRLTLIEIFQKNLNECLRAEIFVAQSVIIEDYIAEDILAATMEMNMRVDGTWVEDDEERYLQHRFKTIISTKYNMPIEEVTTRISISFCKNHPDFLLGDL